ncbi:hypothetical protein BCV70DRAFT_196826 [Testicularia cyperi]|uniref:HCNGP-domain-containing protein n=1 Tax=Testicularia cyperi TaxID=1882483 RepID=A0A317XXC2_9BASI|nr:hypothetical protein BCV70DRAFT_196826 [Testicularia cyperi]
MGSPRSDLSRNHGGPSRSGDEMRDRSSLESGRQKRARTDTVLQDSSPASQSRKLETGSTASSSTRHEKRGSAHQERTVSMSKDLSQLPQPFTEAQLAEIEDEETRRILPLLLPPAERRPDGTLDPLWGLTSLNSDPSDTCASCDPALEAKLARFHELKMQGTHFNESLMSNRSFNNPHIYSKLVDFVDIDETRSNFPDLVPGGWNPHDKETLRQGDPDRLVLQQDRERERREQKQKRGIERKIAFRSSSTPSDPHQRGRG